MYLLGLEGLLQPTLRLRMPSVFWQNLLVRRKPRQDLVLVVAPATQMDLQQGGCLDLVMLKIQEMGSVLGRPKT